MFVPYIQNKSLESVWRNMGGTASSGKGRVSSELLLKSKIINKNYGIITLWIYSHQNLISPSQ